MAAGLLALSCSSSFSEDIYGTTNNAAANGLSWNMQDVLPPQAGLTIGSMFYRYTMIKDPETDAIVYVRNKRVGGEGYAIEESDDWSGLPGTTIVKLIGLPNVPRDEVGTGSIDVEGDGQVVDPTVIYGYRYDECYIVLSNPACPGYLDALLAWLLENGLLDDPPEPNDPYYDEWVQAQLLMESEEQDEEKEEKTNEDLEEEEEKERIIALTGDINIEQLGGENQNLMLIQLNNVPNFDVYYTQDISGGIYEDTIVLQDSNISDNRSAMRNLASDEKHRLMVRSQYD